MTKKYYSISIVTITLNTRLDEFKRCLESIKMQKYPRRNIEHIVVDAGSTNGTIELAKKYNCKVVLKKNLKYEEHVRASLGIKMAKGKLILIMESDNFLDSPYWMDRMVEPFRFSKNVFFTFSQYNSYEKDMPATTRYCALFGVTDPTLYFLQKSEKTPLTQKKYDKGTILKEKPHFYVVKFTPKNLPALGDNGHLFLKSAIDKVNKDPRRYAHTDAVHELVAMGHDTFGVVKNSIVHLSKASLIRFVTRKIEVKHKFYDDMREKRTYLIFDWHSSKDWMNLFFYIFASFTFVIPLYQSIKGYSKIRDSAWFLHPILCFMMVVGYSFAELDFQIRNLRHKKYYEK